MNRWLQRLFGNNRPSMPSTRINNRRASLQVEELETRSLMSASVVLSTVTNAIALNALQPAVVTQAQADFKKDGSITCNDMLGLFAAVEANGPVTASELQGLRTVVADAASFKMPDYVSGLANNVVNGNPANANYQFLGSNGAVWSTPLGNLNVGRSATQLEELVNKWFLGSDYPTAQATNPTAAAVYSPISGTLFSAPLGQPCYTDVQQTTVGDCWVMSSFEEAALQAPAVVKSMFTFVGSNTVNGTPVDVWAVRFYVNGTPTFFTVNNELPVSAANDHYIADAPATTPVFGLGSPTFLPESGHTVVTVSLPSQTVLWAALGEKAYAELSGNSYLNLNDGGCSQLPLAEITGRNVTSLGFYTIDGDVIGVPVPASVANLSSLTNMLPTSSSSAGAVLSDLGGLIGVGSSAAASFLENATGHSENYYQSEIVQAFDSGQLVTLGTPPSGLEDNANLAPEHMYALVGIKEVNGSYSFILGNPWGTGQTTVNGYPGTVTLTENELFSDCMYLAFTTGTGA